MVVFIFICAFWIVVNVYRDYGVIRFNSKLWHRADALYRVVMAVYVSYLAMGSVMYGWLFLAVYWILFDLLLNRKRNLDWDYVGTTSDLDVFHHFIGKTLKVEVAPLMMYIKTINLLLSLLFTFVICR